MMFFSDVNSVRNNYELFLSNMYFYGCEDSKKEL